ncbi:MAG: hypothetical protein II144_00360 [Paludibacteraceae bacterium]|nr:hypothetical protein [Paludibacteraceae bacterium]
MKIIGFVYNDGQTEMVLKGDSCLLNGRKPLFMPDWTQELGVTECIILRVSRLGKEIAPQFANRYYDAIAPGADFIAMDVAREAQKKGRPWTRALAFDFSLAIGEWTKGEWTNGEWLMSPEEAISEASKVMTIRQGDLIYIQAKQAPRKVEKEEIIRKEVDGRERLYCKIK